MELNVDLTNAPRRIIRAQLSIDVHPGLVRLAYPKWIQGHHAPVGPIGNLVGLKFFSNGRRLEWSRDPEEMYVFRVQVPENTDHIQVELAYLAPTLKEADEASTSPYLAVLNWNEVMLYPMDVPFESIECQARLELPSGWKFATALPVLTRSEASVTFQKVPVVTLLDSPVLSGEYMRTIDLSPGSTPDHLLDLAADSPAALNIPQEAIEDLRRTVREEKALFGAMHYSQYHFLFALSDQLGDPE